MNGAPRRQLIPFPPPEAIGRSAAERRALRRRALRWIAAGLVGVFTTATLAAVMPAHLALGLLAVIELGVAAVAWRHAGHELARVREDQTIRLRVQGIRLSAPLDALR